MDKKYLLEAGNLIEIPVKNEFLRTACRHDFRKGKLLTAEDIKRRKHFRKDVKVCIKCGQTEGAKYGYKEIHKKTI